MSQLYEAIRAAGSPISTDEKAFTKQFSFSEAFIGFDGHFPGNPILPAMVQLMLGEIVAAEAAGKSFVTSDAARAKFVRQVVPGELITVSGTLSEKDGATKANITLTVDGETASTYVLILVEPS